MEEKLGTQNEYGKEDLTPLNAVNIIKTGVIAEDDDAPIKTNSIVFDGLEYLGKEKLYLKEYKLSPAEVIKQCHEVGLKMDMKTLQRRVKGGLLSKPYSKGKGQGLGTVVLYRVDAPAELFASEKLAAKLKLGKNLKKVAQIRAIACMNDKERFWREVFNGPDSLAAAAWLYYYAEALKQEMPVRVYWKKQQGLGTGRRIDFELIPCGFDDPPEGFEHLEVLNVITVNEEDDPALFGEWWNLLQKLES